MFAMLFKWIIKPIIGVLVGQTAIQLAHLFGFYPDRLLAEGVYGLMTQVPSPEMVEFFQWGLAAIIGLSLLGIYEFVKSRRHRPVVEQNFAVERRQIAETEIATLTADEKAALRQMLITGRPKNLSDQIWQSLESKTSFVERDFTGPKGIKNEFRPALEEILNKTPNLTDGLDVEPLSPDWSMKELCQHVLDNIDDSEEVIREIEAKARLGELVCWGRKYSAVKADDNPNPLRPIPPEHWDDFSLDYLRCVMHEDSTECRTEPRGSRGDHTGSYQDLQVNRHQSMSIWYIKSE